MKKKGEEVAIFNPTANKTTIYNTRTDKWQSVIDRVNAEKKVYQLYDDLEELNKAVNSLVTYKLDDSDYWQSPTETTKLGSGDCEDIAILKLFHIKGDINNRFLCIGYIKKTKQAHAVAVAKDGHEWVVMDNLKDELILYSEYIKGFRPIMLMNEVKLILN